MHDIQTFHRLFVSASLELRIHRIPTNYIVADLKGVQNIISKKRASWVANIYEREAAADPSEMEDKADVIFTLLGSLLGDSQKSIEESEVGELLCLGKDDEEDR